MKIAILGAGVFGTALGDILINNNYEVFYYDPKFGQNNLNEIITDAELMIFAAPSEAEGEILPKLPKNIPLVVASKGFLNDDVFAEFENWMVLAGVGFADEIKAGKTTNMTITDERLAELFAADFINFDVTDDKKGVLMCGALKNVYAMIAGYKNLEPDSEPWQEYINTVILETKSLLASNGAKPETFDLACGLEDLKLSCGLPSRNYEFGQMLTRDSRATPTKTVEGVTILQKIQNNEINIPDDVVILKSFLEEMNGIK